MSQRKPCTFMSLEAEVKSLDAWLWTIHIFSGRCVWRKQQEPSNNEIILHQEEK